MKGSYFIHHGNLIGVSLGIRYIAACLISTTHQIKYCLRPLRHPQRLHTVTVTRSSKRMRPSTDSFQGIVNNDALSDGSDGGAVAFKIVGLSFLFLQIYFSNGGGTANGGPQIRDILGASSSRSFNFQRTAVNANLLQPGSSTRSNDEQVVRVG